MFALFSLALAAEVSDLDIVFQDSQSSQAEAIKTATRSPWSHVGVVFERDGTLYVLEAVQPVRFTPYARWKARGRGGEVGVRRLPFEVSREDRDRLLKTGTSWVGRDYDAQFGWDDSRLYCSELVTKLFAEIDVELGEKATVASFHLDSPHVAAQLAKRGLPLDREVVSPASIYDDPDLVGP